MTFADILYFEMGMRGMSRADLAAKIGVSEVCVGHWVNGRWLPKVPQALKLARLFGRTVESCFPEL